MFQSLEWGPHHADASSLSEAVARGCYICNPISQSVVQQCGEAKNCVAAPWSYRVYKHETGVQVIIDMQLWKEGEVVQECQSFMAIPSSGITFNSAIRDRRTSLPLSDASATAGRWLRQCLDGHDQCQKNTQPSSYPERLVEIQSSSSTVRIISPAEGQITGPYVALSHVGSSHPSCLRLSASNLKELQTGISFSKLPNAFREAIDFITHLSIRYVWIDVLCTMPCSESPEEQHTKWTKLQDIYTNSIFALSLAAAAHLSESCLGGCPPHTKLPFEVETAGLAGRNDTTQCRYTAIFWDYYHTSLYDQPVGHRAESVQERLWPPRVLSLGLGELFWDCIQVPNASESFPDGPGDLKNIFSLKQKAIPKTSDRKELSEFWWQVLEEYTDCELAHPGADKLGGLSTIADQLATAMDDVYVSGHFWSTLPASLNWQVLPPLAAGKRRGRRAQRITSETNHIPSWSWASMDGTLYIPRAGRRRETSLADAEAYTLIPANTSTPSAGIVSATLRIKTYCVESEWTNGCAVIHSEFWTRVQDCYWLRVNLDDDHVIPTEGARYLLAALVEDDWLRKWEGLFLQEVSIDGQSFYRRVGHYSLCHNHGSGRRSEWRDDYRTLCGPPKVITLV